MKNLLGKKVKFVNGSKVEFGTIYDITADGKKVWIETKEDMFVVLMENVELIKETPKEKVKMSFAKNESRDAITDELESRSLVVYVESTNEDLLIEFCSRMSEELGEEFAQCPYVENGLFGDAMYLPFEYGNMSALKDDIKYVFKKIKKEFGIR